MKPGNQFSGADRHSKEGPGKPDPESTKSEPTIFQATKTDSNRIINEYLESMEKQ
ncbi:hypothetical protein [Longilinea arvoryzae]|uniref:hypothetical protein n=1 Tax=Longilinea arvoryzae TaxID=360412 RepID=UPI001560EEF9|nr:hypothetical protein [Longilinea arvoryzae]